MYYYKNSYLKHWGILGMKWGHHRKKNDDEDREDYDTIKERNQVASEYGNEYSKAKGRSLGTLAGAVVGTGIGVAAYAYNHKHIKNYSDTLSPAKTNTVLKSKKLFSKEYEEVDAYQTSEGMSPSKIAKGVTFVGSLAALGAATGATIGEKAGEHYNTVKYSQRGKKECEKYYNVQVAKAQKHYK